MVRKLDKKDHKLNDISAEIVRGILTPIVVMVKIALTPIFALVKVYRWVWDDGYLMKLR